METTIIPPTSSITSSSPCDPDEVAISPGDCVEGQVEKWLEDEALAGFRVWQLAGIVLSILLAIIVALCCCIRFRIPRTKQNIEADYIRKRLTKNFRRELSKISNTEMDEMDLRKALERVRADLDIETDGIDEEQIKLDKKLKKPSLSETFNTMFQGLGARFSKKSLVEKDNVI